MKKKFLLLSVLGVTYGLQAQVGINKTDPKATLDITVKTENATNNNLEGLLIPRVSKEKAYQMTTNVDSSSSEKLLEESTLIYVNDVTGYAGSDDTVADVTENGYYFWNGEKWVKQIGKNGELWAQHQADGVNETYLKSANANNDFIGYKQNRRFGINLGGNDLVESDFYWPYGTFKGFDPNEVPLWNVVTSDVFLQSSTLGRNRNYIFNSDQFFIKGDHVNNAIPNPAGKIYVGKDYYIHTDAVPTSSVFDVFGATTVLDFSFQGGEHNILALKNKAIIREGGTVKNATVGDFEAHNLGTSENLIVLSSVLKNNGTINNMRGLFNSVASQAEKEGSYVSHSIQTVRGIDNRVFLSPNATLKGGIAGVDSKVTLMGNIATVDAEVNLYGTHNQVVFEGNLPQNKIHVDRNSFTFGENALIKDLHLNQSAIHSEGEGNSITGNMYVFDYKLYNSSNWTASKMYGIYLDQIINGQTANYGLYIENVGNNTSNINYSIYTKAGKVRFGDNVGVGVDNPTEKLEVSGKIKASNVIFTDIQEYDDNTAAIAAGLQAGEMYRTGDVIKIVHD